jgi:mycoredoxin
MSMTSSSPVTVFWRPGCPYCARLRSRLKRAGVDVDEVNIWDDPAGAAFVRSAAGGSETVPTVRVGNRALVNPAPAELIAVVRDLDPSLVPDHPIRHLPDMLWLFQWLALIVFLVLSVVAEIRGHTGLSWTFDVVAASAFLLVRWLRVRR